MSLADVMRGRARKATGSAVRSLIRQADAERDARSWDKAAAGYEAVLAASPNLAHIWVQYGHALKESGRRPDAEAAYRKALALDASVADTHLQLGHVLKLTGRLDEAAGAYLQALRLDSTLADALGELNALSVRGVRPAPGAIADILPAASPASADGSPSGADSDLELARTTLARLIAGGALPPGGVETLQRALGELDGLAAATPAPDQGATTLPALVFDVADLFGYFRNARLPTGIQRVQIEVISALLRRAGARPIQVCSFSEALDDWVEVPARLFLELAGLALAAGDVTAPDWIAALHRLDIALAGGRPLRFPDGAVLINLGTSWWLQNYFLQVRRAKAEHGVRYVPFVHDLIPVMTPEHCVEGLTQDFISWVLGVFQHADFFLVNSHATRRDLARVAAQLGHVLDETRVEVVRLDADARKLSTEPPARSLKSFGLEPGRFVLFVSTIESRKNHLGAFNAWLTLIRRHGAAAVPKLVCVGNEGWLNDAVHARLKSSELLRERVVMLSKLSDAELAMLYRGCLFTLYPSHYEGWGLPVTESLCYGKVPLVSDASSLPEAGGEFADYFEAGSEAALTQALERLMFDRPRLAERERAIVAGFAPRAWADIGSQIQDAVNRWATVAESGEAPPAALRAASAMPAELGRYYPMQRNLSLRIWRDMVAGEMFRTGAGWWWPDDWGAWTRPGGGQLAIRVPGPHRALRGMFRIRGLLDAACDWTAAFEDGASDAQVLRGTLQPESGVWLQADFPASAEGLTLIITLRAPQTQDLALRTGNLDRRITSLGFEGFHLAEAEDVLARLDFAEALASGGLDRLTPGFRYRWS